MSAHSSRRARIAIVGGGFAGYHAARILQKAAPDADIVLINPTDYFLYLPLLPEVAAGLLEPRRICISLRHRLGSVRLQLGTAESIDIDNRHVAFTDPEGNAGTVAYDRILIAVGSVNTLLPIPGVAQNAHGMRGLAEALFLRDHITRQLELAAMSTDPADREARCTFVVVGGGYTGTETAAQGQLLTHRLAKSMPALRAQKPRWMLLDTAPRLLHELDRTLAATAERVLRRRGVDVRTGQSISQAGPDSVTLTTGEHIPTRSLIWCVGVRPDPLVDDLGLATVRGRLVVDTRLQVPGHPEIFACGDCASTPDLTRPGHVTGMTAQHAMRQGRVAALNLAASLTSDNPDLRNYRHHDLGFLVHLAGTQAAANPLRVPLSGLPAKMVTRGYHLLALPGNRIRTATDWAMNLTGATPAVQLGLIDAGAAGLMHHRSPLAVTSTPPAPESSS